VRGAGSDFFLGLKILGIRPRMRALLLAFCSAGLVLTSSVAQAQNTPSSTFVGTWVGTQKWAIDSPSPSAKEDQPVELTIQLDPDGKLSGFMNPWFGGSDGATITDAKLVGEELHAQAVVGKPPVAGARGQRGNWKSVVKILFKLKSEGNNTLAGTADVTLDNIKWLKFDYSLAKKRARY
jgi:hypothetical protein